jgi:hypothetical protein
MHSGARYVRQELPHERLSGGMEMDLRILDEEDVLPVCGERRDDDGQDLGQPETGVDRPMEIRALGGAKTEGHGVRLLDLLNRQGASGKDRPHSLFHLA